MSPVYTRNFDDPDEVIEIEKVRSEILSLGGMGFSHDTQEPGWRWSEHIRPLVGTEWCETRHVGYVLKGHMRIRLKDGTEFDCRPGDVMDIPAGHDGWILGDEPFESLAWMGGTTWLSPLQTLKERVLVTLLFTDIVDSTGVAQRLGDQGWGDLLNSHNQRMAESVDRFRGRLTKFTGDGLLALFDGAARAIRCALTCRREAADLGLTIRAAVHTGEVELAGDEIQGIAVHEASRIMTHAGPGEVLVSDVTRIFARDPQMRFDDLGEFELRGMDETLRLHSVTERETTHPQGG
jgi:class 3 adenylate cyclase